MTDAHSVTQHFTVIQFFPEHSPREDDPHYSDFEKTRRRLKKLGKLVCWIGNEDCDGGIELHHALVEYALINLVDVQKFKTLYPELGITSDEDFLRVVESEGALTPLCVRHHRGDLGIHCTTYPSWLCQRFKKTGSPAPERRVPAH